MWTGRTAAEQFGCYSDSIFLIQILLTRFPAPSTGGMSSIHLQTFQACHSVQMMCFQTANVSAKHLEARRIQWTIEEKFGLKNFQRAET